MNIIVVNVTCLHIPIITVITFAWFPAFSVYGTAWFMCDVADGFGFCGCRFSLENCVNISVPYHIMPTWLI